MVPLGTWWASVPSERWPDSEALRNYLAAYWEDHWGDRRQEIVFIGADIDWPALSARLDSALLPEGFDPDSVELDDPFPIWNRQDIQ